MKSFDIMAAVHEGRTTDIVQVRHPGPAGLVRTTAAKRLRRECRGDAALEEAFLAEARVGIALDHHNLVTVLGANRDLWQIEMEYLRGWSLKQVQDRVGALTALPLEVAIAICQAVGQGLGHMHDRGFAHRHITPSNIMITTEGGTKIVDFGAATVGSQKRPASRYTAPEFFTRRRELDARADIYSLGAILFELTTGHRLFAGGAHRSSMRQIVDGSCPRPSEADSSYPRSLELIVRRAMASKPEDRFKNISEMLDALEDFAALGDFNPSPRMIARFTSAWPSTRVRGAGRRARGSMSGRDLMTDVDSVAIADVDMLEIEDIEMFEVVDEGGSQLATTQESIPRFEDAPDTVEA